MPATTRSKNKRPRLEDLPTTLTVQKNKRKASQPSEKAAAQTSPQSKRLKSTPTTSVPQERSDHLAESEKASASSNRKIHINRSPVLHLWAACTTKFLHPDLDWSTCISAGGAVATLCAVAKGRSVGKIEEQKNKDKSDGKGESLKEPKLEVMHFKLEIKDGLAMVGGKPKPGNEGPLASKFANEYQNVKTVFEQGLESWKGDSDTLNDKAFSFYESFRPSVASGQAGWGRKGTLDLDKVEKIIQNLQGLFISNV